MKFLWKSTVSWIWMFLRALSDLLLMIEQMRLLVQVPTKGALRLVLPLCQWQFFALLLQRFQSKIEEIMFQELK
jgi:hypothetical protein